MPAALAATSLTTNSATPATGIATLLKPASDTLTEFQVSGTYGTVTNVFSGTYDGTLWFPVNGTNVNDGSPANGTITQTDNATRLFAIWSPGMIGIRLEVSAIASGTLVVSAQSNSYVGLPANPTSAVTTYGNITAAGTITGTSASASALTVGLNGATNPALKVDDSTASSATGLLVKSAAAASGAALSVISSGTNENLTIDAKGSGTIDLNATGTGNILTPRAILSRSATAGSGYAVGAGGAVTQATNRTTGVTLSKPTGTITTNNASLAAEAAAEFTVTNTLVAVTDVIVLSIQSGTNGGNTEVFVSVVAAGSFNIKVANNNAAAGTAETGAILINYCLIKGVIT